MSKLSTLLPSLQALIAFEAAARNLSFKLAANELNVTQPSISHAIKVLEQRCQSPLFVRENRGVRLTEAGRMLFEGVRAGFSKIEGGLEAAMGRDASYLTLAVSSSMGAYWLIPQLYEFHRKHPDIKLRVLTTDRDLEPEGNVDMTIWLRSRDWQRSNSHYLCDEVVFPICASHYLSTHPRFTRISELSGQKLIQYVDVYRERLGWSEWLRRAQAEDQEPPSDLVFNDYQFAMQAALAGEGVALGWSFTSQLLIKNKILVRPIEEEVVTGNAFFFVTSRYSSESLQIAKFLSWILEKTKDLRS